MRRWLIALTLAVLLMTGFQGLAWAQGFRVNGGLDLQPLRPSLGFTVTVERPSFELFGVRFGPIVTVKGQTDFQQASVQALTGFAGAVVLPSSSWSVKIKLLLNTTLQTGEPFAIGPEFQLTFSAIL